jgi:CubicO group peptidase (beta-lactamase class C family)
MYHFLLAQLQEGCYDGSCILKPETLALMHQAQAPTPYEGQSVTFGFVEGIFPEGKMLGHSGATRGFGSLVQFLPEHDMGFFIVFNQECLLTEACTILHEFRMQFLKQFLR